MVEFYKTVDGRVTEISEFAEGCWVNMVHPSSDELETIARAARVEEEFVRAALDPEESSRIETEDDQLLMIVDIPMVEKNSVEDGGQMFSTLPMGIIVGQNAVITVCLEDSIILRSIAEGAVKGVHTALRTRFVFQILLRVAGRFLKNLRMIERDFTRIEKRLYDSLKNEELIQLLGPVSYTHLVFMGDTGSLFLGGAVAGLAFACDTPLILLLVGLIYIIETLSVILQVTYFKATGGKRLFKMAPIHHHFEMCGWGEKKIVLIFCGVTALLCLVAYFCALMPIL